jgi:uncharacterized Zn-binding protein involved in type VI secretion
MGSKQPSARLGDIDTGHPGAGPTPIITASSDVKINGIPAARKGDQLKKHHKGIRVIVQGSSNVNINGRPAARVTDNINCGGKINVGAPNVFVGCESSVKALPIKAVAFESASTSQYLELESTFARDELFKFARKCSEVLFMKVMMEIFGLEIPASAYHKLYQDAQKKADILTIEHLVRYGFGGFALFHSPKEKQTIWVDEYELLKAKEDNEQRGILMVALVEEYGHYLDYLLRFYYSDVGGDAENDEGAKYSYNIIDISALEDKDQYFADLIENGNKSPLIWDFEEFHVSLKAYVSEERQRQNDRAGEYEFFKAGFFNLSGNLNIYGHGDIENLVFQKLIRRKFDKPGPSAGRIETEEVDEIIHTIYLGNWLRDYSQVIDAGLVRPVSYGLGSIGGWAESSGVEIQDVKVEINLGDVLKKLNVYDYAGGLKDKKIKFRPVTLTVEALTTVVELMAVKEFVHERQDEEEGEKKEGEDAVEDYRGYRDYFRKNYLDITPETLGPYRPEEHIDNPKGIGHDENGQDAGTKAIYNKFVGYVPDDSPLNKVNKRYGMKNYIRSDFDATFDVQGDNYPTAFQYIVSQLKKSAGPGGFENPQQMIDFGAALHTLEDYFAHTNYTEVALIKSVQPLVFPWITSVEDTGFQYVYAEIEQGIGFGREFEVFDDPSIAENLAGKHKLAACIPIVTGTFGIVDTAASVLPVINEKVLSVEPEAWEKEGAPGQRSFADILVLELFKDIDRAQSDEFDNTGENDKFFEEKFELYLFIRDLFRKDIKWWAPDLVHSFLHNIEEIYHALFDFIPYEICRFSITLLNDAQVALSKDLDLMYEGTFDIGSNPSHTQVGKDDPHHPLHTLAAKLAMEAVRRVSDKMFDVWLGKGDVNRVIAELDIIMRHPAETIWQEQTVKDWAVSNKRKVCSAVSPSTAIDTVLHQLEEQEKIIKNIEGYLSSTSEVVINKINAYFSVDEQVKNDPNMMTNFVKEAKTIQQQLRDRSEYLKDIWHCKFATPSECQVFSKYYEKEDGSCGVRIVPDFRPEKTKVF